MSNVSAQPRAISSYRSFHSPHRERREKKRETIGHCERSGNEFCQRDIFREISIIIRRTTYVGSKIFILFVVNNVTGGRE